VEHGPEPVPDALAVEWQGRRLCEKLYEDDHIRILRCTFRPGDVHLRHCHPPAFNYVLSGGTGTLTDANGTTHFVSETDSCHDMPAIPWHEGANTGETTLRYLVVEKKYQK
jgi:quercetin dioxygenase-like cupin family protein